ncbi:syntaxin protein [Cystoisospora suis]|uniref:Syntaxin protein n=1 Tax=Cystoisospora suis TaxID=483139 RepID=A0A2C6KN94_9APIC|nr:syntaxin protein [Cystoisospora suis]
MQDLFNDLRATVRRQNSQLAAQMHALPLLAKGGGGGEEGKRGARGRGRGGEKVTTRRSTRMKDKASLRKSSKSSFRGGDMDEDEEEEEEDGSFLKNDRKKRGAGGSDERDLETGGVVDEGEQGGGPGDFMSEYFRQIQVLKKAIQEIGKNLEKMKSLKQEVLSATNPDEERDVSHYLNKLLDATMVMIRKTKDALKAIKESNDLFVRQYPEKISEGRIRFNMHQILSRQLQQITVECQQAETEYKTVIKKRVCRQVQIVYPEASGEEIEELVESGDLSAAMAVKMKVTGTHQSLRNAVADLQDKYRDILRLEQSVAELHQMFMELAFLVEQQGELLDQIQYNVIQAKDYTAQAEKELLQARKNQKSAKKRMCWLSVCILVIIMIVLIPVILTIVK